MPKARISLHVDPETCIALDAIAAMHKASTGARASRIEVVRMLTRKALEARTDLGLARVEAEARARHGIAPRESDAAVLSDPAATLAAAQVRAGVAA